MGLRQCIYYIGYLTWCVLFIVSFMLYLQCNCVALTVHFAQDTNEWELSFWFPLFLFFCIYDMWFGICISIWDWSLPVCIKKNKKSLKKKKNTTQTDPQRSHFLCHSNSEPIYRKNFLQSVLFSVTVQMHSRSIASPSNNDSSRSTHASSL